MRTVNIDYLSNSLSLSYSELGFLLGGRRAIHPPCAAATPHLNPLPFSVDPSPCFAFHLFSSRSSCYLLCHPIASTPTTTRVVHPPSIAVHHVFCVLNLVRLRPRFGRSLLESQMDLSALRCDSRSALICSSILSRRSRASVVPVLLPFV